MTVASLNVPEVAEIYILANTPLFFIKRVEQNAVARTAALRLSVPEILKVLEDNAAGVGEKLDDWQALFCLVALSIKGDGRALKKATLLDLPARWYAAVGGLLIQRYRPMTTSLILQPNFALARAQSRVAQSVPTTISEIKVN